MRTTRYFQLEEQGTPEFQQNKEITRLKEELNKKVAICSTKEAQAKTLRKKYDCLNEAARELLPPDEFLKLLQIAIGKEGKR